MAIVYTHKRLDNNEIFYVGIGLSDKRSFSNKSRNPIWHNIVNKTEYIIEILHKDITWEEACNIEKELIKKYGRRDLGTGILVNMTDGGDGTINLTKEVIQKRKNNTDYKNPETIAKRILNTNYKDPLRLAKINTPEAHAKRVSKINWEESQKKRLMNIDFSYTKTPEFRAKINTPEAHAKKAAKCKKPIIQLDLDGNFIKEWSSAIDVYRTIKINASSIMQVCKGKYKHAGGFKWKYKKDVDNV